MDVDSIKEIQDTKFFNVLLTELLRPHGSAQVPAPIKNATAPSSLPEPKKKPQDSREWYETNNDITHLEELIGELEARRSFALVSITPQKMTRMGGNQLMALARESSNLIGNIKKEITVLQAKLKKDNRQIKDSHNNLSEDERKRIDNLIGGGSAARLEGSTG